MFKMNAPITACSNAVLEGRLIRRVIPVSNSNLEEHEMTKLISLSALAVSALVASTGLASAFSLGFAVDKQTYPTGESHSPQIIVECRVRDADFWIMNFGNDVLDSGRQIAWRSPTTGDEGVVLLPKMLGPGEEVKLADVLTDDAHAGAPCTAALV
jgi:hypothetical protein